MTLPTTPPRRAWLDRAPLLLASVPVLLGAGTMAGWWLGSDELVQPFPGTAPLGLAEAGAIWLLGLAFLALELGRRRLALLALAPALLGLVALGAWALRRNLSLEAWSGGAQIPVGLVQPGTLSLVAAASLLLGGVALVGRALGDAGRGRRLAEAVIGSLLAATAFSTLLGYAASLPVVYSWGTVTATAPVGAIAILFFGAALIMLAWRESYRADGEPPAWSPMPAVIACLALTVVLWIGLREREDPGVQTQNALVLTAGLGITFLLGLSGDLWRRARAGQNAAEHSNQKLLAENEERRRIEARLKVSDERLRLALDSTQIGIYEWSVPAGHVYYSPGLWAMLGYEHSRMPSNVEAWQSLIHPDDLPLFRRRTESQLAGIATFIEPEYRVRARSGDWRWVYTRSKSVAAGDDGRPTRIIGTVQDVTARREAELALRESQAEARKLSLVASKTDNPVLIGSPDGRIEWANEAFCRVMEYRLEEVVGKNPAHFLVGPETDRRSLVHIRTALRAGQGISTDLVNYSKSGRKYHVHIELQPVRGSGGEVENFIAVETDITARVATERELRRAKAEADDASRAKSEFLASMSHEIRTPMNGVIGMTSLLMETTLSPEQRDFVGTIRTSGDALLTIINDILDFSKIESGKLELEQMPFDLPLCLEEALDLFALQATAKKLELTYHIAPDVPAWIVGDVTRLRQVVVNLVNNAVKFTPSGSIAVEVRRITRELTLPGFGTAPAPDPARMMLEFTVSDTGIGIPPDRLDRLFKAFSQVDSSTTRKYGGTGLGLVISQRLCGLMGGTVRAESSPDHGSAFIFTIRTAAAEVSADSGLPPLPALLREGTVLCVDDHPVTQARLRTLFEKWGVKQVLVATDATAALALAAQLPAPPALLVVDHSGGESAPPFASLDAIACPRLLLCPFGQTAPVAPAGQPPFASSTKPIRTSYLTHAVVALFHPRAADSDAAAKKTERPIGEEIPLVVLLAEDNAVNQKVALRFLERLGYRADAVANGLEAVTTAEGRNYDLVLMDVQMPEMDGYEATRQIRARLPAHRQPKIFALTANAMEGDRALCVAAGMDDHISKPVKMHEIAAAIRRHFGRP